EVGRAKAEFLQALAQAEARGQTLEQLRETYRKGGLSEARYREAAAAAREAQVRLVAAQQALLNLGLPVRAEDVRGLAPADLGRRVQFLGLPPEVVNLLDPRTPTANLIPVKAPLDGVVVARKVGAGEQVDPSRTLFVVADTRRLWLTLNVRPQDARSLRPRDALRGTPGQPVRF